MVKTKTIRDLLAEHPFFDGMADPYLDLIAGCGENVHFKTGAFLMREGEEATSFFLLRKGIVAIEAYCPVKGGMTVSQRHEGDVVGFSWLFPPYRTAFDACARTDVEAVMLHGDCFRGKAQQDHELGYELMSRFTHLMLGALQATRRQMLDVYGGTDVAANS